MFKPGDKIVRIIEPSSNLKFLISVNSSYTFKMYNLNSIYLRLEEIPGLFYSDSFILEEIYNSSLYQLMSENEENN